MEENKSKLYEVAKKVIDKRMRKVIKEDPKLIDEEDIRVQTELQLVLKLTKTVKDPNSLSDESEKTIQYIMQVFNKAFHEMYELYCEEQQPKNKEKEEEQDKTQERTDENNPVKKEQEDLEI